MNRHFITTEDWERINRFLPLLYREIDPERQRQAMFATLHAFVPGECIALDSFNLKTNTITTITAPVDFGNPEGRNAIIKYIHQSPYTAYFTMVSDSEWKSITDFLPLEDFRQTELHREGFARLGVQHQILGIVGRTAKTLFSVSVNRTSDQPFTNRERTLLKILHPHLCNSLLNAQSFARIQDNVQTLTTTLEQVSGAYAYFGPDRRLVWRQSRTDAWLEQFLPDEKRDAKGMPQTVTQLVASADDQACHFETENGSHRLCGCLLPASIGGWILRLERKPLIPAGYFYPLAQLSPRENEVLRWMVEGKRNAEIAAILHASARTVEKQVQSILAKLGVENRASAIIRAMELAAATHQNGTGI